MHEGYTSALVFIKASLQQSSDQVSKNEKVLSEARSPSSSRKGGTSQTLELDRIANLSSRESPFSVVKRFGFNSFIGPAGASSSNPRWNVDLNAPPGEEVEVEVPNEESEIRG